MTQQQMDSNSLIGAFRDAGLIIKGIACVVILTFGGLVTSPAVAAVKQEVRKIQWTKPDNKAAALSKTLKDVHRLLDNLPLNAPTQVPTTATTNAATAPATFTAKQTDAFKAAREQLKAYHDQLKILDQATLDQFASVKAHIIKHHLPQVILDREAKAETTYKTRMSTLMAELNAANASTDNATFQRHVLKMKAQLDKEMVKPVHEKFDPNHMPFSVAKPKHIKPRLTKKEYEATLFKRKPIQVATIGSLTGLLASSSLPSNPNDPAYVAPTDDVQITDAIKAKAAALNHDPVQIYNWVHNNIEYIPTYGSIQGSDMTLQTLRGNDFDTASLLIALLRASNIPARYVYGTIQVPIKQVENWVGGVTDPNAALNLLGEGGIPVTGVAQGGVIQNAQLEHVWVEAWVNYFPSRAAKPGPGNSWVPMDASFKQYAYTPGMDLQKSVPFDVSSFRNYIEANSNVDYAGGSIQGLDQSYLQSEIQNYKDQVATYINNANQNATLSDILGDKIINAANNTELSASLPYSVLVIGARETSLPESLRWKFQYNLADQYGNQLISFEESTAKLAGNEISISFQPASDSDAATIASYADESFSNGIADVSQPATIPGYLIHVVPIISINGNQVSSSTTQFAIGDSLKTTHGYWSPGDGWRLKNNSLTAGEYTAMGLDLQGISQDQIDSMASQLAKVSAILQSGTLDGLTGHDLTGSLLQATILSYFATTDSQDLLEQRLAKVVEYRKPSFGLYKTTAKVNYLYGLPNSVGFTGGTMDIEWYETIGISEDNSKNNLINFYTAAGPRLSLMESVVPENIFSVPGAVASGISTTKLLALASSQGQSIYAITSQNAAAILPKLNYGSSVLDDINSAINSGKEVIIPQSPINYAGWGGAGYVVYDPATGTGAYLLNGGANGSALEALSYVFTAIGLSIGSKSALAAHYGAGDIAEGIENYFLRYLAVAAFTVNVLKVGLKCSGARASDVIIGLAAATILALGLLSVFAFLGPIWIFLIGILLDQMVEAFTEWMEKSFCRAQTILDSIEVT